MPTTTKPMQARWTASLATVLVASAFALTGCARDGSTSPMGASKDLVGALNQTYTFVVNTGQDTGPLSFGNSYLDIPANAICDLASSGYGSAYWNSPCTPQAGVMTITATVAGEGTDNPSVEFNPPLRFNPSNPPTLRFAASDTATLSNMTVILYCPAGSPTVGNSTCVNEAIADSSLTSSVNFPNMTVTRFIKHFSGYLVAEDSSANSDARRHKIGGGL